MARLRSPIKWIGGKGLMKKKLLPILENIPHTRYIEPYGGAAHLLIAKNPVSIETYNDIHSGLYNFFMVLSDPKLFSEFERRVSLLPVSRELFVTYKHSWKTETDNVLKAVMFFVVARQGFGGGLTSGWGYCVSESIRGMSKDVSSWLSTIDLLPEIHQRLQRVQIENQDAIAVIQRHDHEDALFYLDPPYVLDTRERTLYQHEMQDKDHENMIDTILNLKAKVVLSGYPHSIYDRLIDNGWHYHSWDTVTFVGTNRPPRIEAIWMNPQAKEAYVK